MDEMSDDEIHYNISHDKCYKKYILEYLNKNKEILLSKLSIKSVEYTEILIWLTKEGYFTEFDNVTGKFKTYQEALKTAKISYKNEFTDFKFEKNMFICKNAKWWNRLAEELRNRR